jgi:hypothetical protein
VVQLTSADVETNVETLGAALETVVVSLAVQVEEFVRVDTVGLETLEHVLGAEVCKSRVIDLDGLEASVVQNLELLLVGSGQVGEESIVGGVDLLGVALAGSKTEMEVRSGRHGELALVPLRLGDLRLEVLPLLEVRAVLVLNLAVADDSHGVLEAGLLQGSNWGSRKSVKIPGCVVDLLEAVELLKETTEVNLTVVLARADGTNTLILLTLDNVGNGLVLSSLELRVGDLLVGSLGLCLLEVGRTEKRANVLGVEGKSDHDCDMCDYGYG